MAEVDACFEQFGHEFGRLRVFGVIRFGSGRNQKGCNGMFSFQTMFEVFVSTGVFGFSFGFKDKNPASVGRRGAHILTGLRGKATRSVSVTTGNFCSRAGDGRWWLWALTPPAEALFIQAVYLSIAKIKHCLGKGHGFPKLIRVQLTLRRTTSATLRKSYQHP